MVNGAGLKLRSSVVRGFESLSPHHSLYIAYSDGWNKRLM